MTNSIRQASRNPNTDRLALWSLLITNPGSSRERTITRHSRSSKHLLRDPEGWAWENEAIEQARENRVDTVIVVDDDTDLIYRAPLESFDRFGSQIDRGYGPETFLPLELWVVSRDNLGQE
jgi:hypothetical protein